MEIRDGFYALVKIEEIIFFIGTVQVVAVETKTHENDFQSKLFFKQGTDRNTTSTSYRAMD